MIRNFRNFENSTFQFKKGVNTLIGENGSGKTNIFHAMRLLLDDSVPNRQRRLIPEDFSRVLKDWRGHWIVVQAFFEDIGDSETEKMLSYAMSDLDTIDTGSYTYLFRPKLEIRKTLHELSNENKKDEIKDLLKGIATEDYEFICICRAKVDLSDESEYEKYVGNFETLKFPDPEDKAYDEIWGNSNSRFVLFDQISCTFIQALRDAVKELKYSKLSPLKKLFEGLENEVSAEDIDEISGNVKNLNSSISSLDSIKEIKSEIEKTILSSVGHSYSPSIDIKSEVPDELYSLFQSLALWVGDPNDDHKGYLDDLSLGGANLVYLSVKLLMYEQQKRKNKITHFLLVEEPEAHIHTHIQKALFGKLDPQNTQIFVSTHSTHISSVSNVSSMNVLSCEKNKSEVHYPTAGMEDWMIQKVERYLDAVRTNLLFAKGVILVEGDAEQILIPAMVKKCLGITLDEMGITLVNIGSTGFENVACLFDEGRIKKKCGIITDLDKSIVDLTLDTVGFSERDKVFWGKQKRSQEKGEKRKEKHKNLYIDNSYVECFYAESTFEIELLNYSENEDAFKEIAKEIYAKNIDSVLEELSDGDAAVYGRRALKMAGKLGKGWFAIELAQKIKKEFLIPEYIIDAISFVARELVSNQLISELISYALGEATAPDEKSILEQLQENKVDDAIASYMQYAEDENSNLYNFLKKLND